MRSSHVCYITAMALTLGLLGCTPDRGTSETSTNDGAKYLTASEPAGAIAVGRARESIADNEPVVLVGRIGGSAEPFVDGMAAFTIVDTHVPHCTPDEGCPTPWDYCCTQDQVKNNIATIKIVDPQGQPISADARDLLGVNELNTVVVRGTAQRDDAGNLSLLADEIYVRP